MSQTSGLTVRQHEREELELSVDFVVAEAHREQVHFSPMSNAAEPHVMRGHANDISSGGMGLVCGLYVPRMCRGTVRVFDPTPCGTSSDGSPIHDVIFEHDVCVRRVSMVNDDVSYAIGVSFVDAAPDIEQRVQRVLDAGHGRTGGEDDDA